MKVHSCLAGQESHQIFKPATGRYPKRIKRIFYTLVLRFFLPPPSSWYPKLSLPLRLPVKQVLLAP